MPPVVFKDANCGYMQYGSQYGTPGNQFYLETFWQINGSPCYGSSQVTVPDYHSVVAVIHSLNHPVNVRAPYYTSRVINFYCYAAVRSWGYDDATANNSCDETQTWYVEAVRHYVHDSFWGAGAYYWTWWY